MTSPCPVPPRAPWVRPAIQRIAAGQAELSQNPMGGDGSFTRS